ncbi:hypothetical protein Q4I30_000848 [Leishmania utingensis]|uniref:Uncharacterized protein n=1 Tax=Leishmania utingensis TaxID=653362 RepID=A0AAW3AXS8_9TRYP
MHQAAGGQNGGKGDRGHDGQAADVVDAASSHPPPIKNVCRALEHIRAVLQQHQQWVSSTTVGEAGRAAADDGTSTHLATPMPHASNSYTDAECSTPQDAAKQQRERYRLLFLTEWAHRVVEAYTPITPAAAQAGTEHLTACPVPRCALAGDEVESTASPSKTLSTQAQRRPAEPSVAAAVSNAAPSGEAAASISGNKADLPPVREASVPVERRLNYSDGHRSAHALMTASAPAIVESSRALLTAPGLAATTHTGWRLHPHTTTAAAATALSLSSPPPPIIPRDRAPLCRLVGVAFDVPTTRAAQCAVLAAQGSCCARCGVALPPPPFYFSEWCSALTRSLCAKLTCSCCGGGQAITSLPCCRRLWHVCLCMARCRSSDEEENERLTAVTAAHVTQEAISSIGSGRGGVRHNARAPLDAPENEDLSSNDGVAGDDDNNNNGSISSASERDSLLGDSTQSSRHNRTRAARRVATRQPASEPAAYDYHRRDETGDGGGGSSADAEFLFCAYEGHYLCWRCFHSPLTGADPGAAMLAAAGSAIGGTLVSEGYQTRYITPEEWQARDADESPVRTALGRASGQLCEWWAARHVAQSTPIASALNATGSRDASGRADPPQQRIAAPLPLCVLPAHVLHRWDFTRFPVSAAAAAVLQRRFYLGNGNGQENCLAPSVPTLERGGQRATAAGGSGYVSRINSEGLPILPSQEEQGARGYQSAPGIPPLRGLEGIPSRNRNTDGTTPPMTPLPQLYDVSAINPSLYVRVPALSAASRLRQQMSLLHAQAWWCPRYRHEVWGLRCGDELAGQVLEEVTAFPLSRQLPEPSPTVVNVAGRSSRPAEVVESAVDNVKAYLLTQDIAPPPFASAAASASRSHSVATPQAASLSAPCSQALSSLSDRATGIPPPHQHPPAAGVAAVPLSLPPRARCHARRRYLVERAEGWSLQDLHRLKTTSSLPPSTGATATPSPPQLLVELQSMFAIMQTHVRGCSACASQCRGLVVRTPPGPTVCRD